VARRPGGRLGAVIRGPSRVGRCRCSPGRTVSFAELAVELVEYPLLDADRFHRSAYYDTLADMADTLVGAVIGAGAGLAFFRRPRA
jgi:hypothetical protein